MTSEKDQLEEVLGLGRLLDAAMKALAEMERDRDEWRGIARGQAANLEAVHHAKPLSTGSEPSSLEGLLARVEAAKGPDRELDARIYVALIARLKNPLIDRMIAERAELRPDANVWLDGARDWQVKPYTASLDAALELVERVLPEAYRDMGEGWDSKAQRRYWIATLTYHVHGRGAHSAEAPTAPLALLAALLTALTAPPSKIEGE